MGVNNENTLTIDIGNDPLWTIAEQDFYALLQRGGYVNSNIYSYAIYYSGANTWGVYHSLIQPYGYGDGSIASDGKAYTNRNYFITPGFKIDYTGTAATNWIANTGSVRGQALLEWMQPAQGRKRMLLCPIGLSIGRGGVDRGQKLSHYRGQNGATGVVARLNSRGTFRWTLFLLHRTLRPPCSRLGFPSCIQGISQSTCLQRAMPASKGLSPLTDAYRSH